MSRRRRPDKPATLSATAMPQSHSIGPAGTVPPGSLGVWVNGEMSIIQAGHSSGGPNTAITPASATALHASAVDSHGSSPNSKTATAASTSTAGSRASAAASRCGTCVLSDPARMP